MIGFILSLFAGVLPMAFYAWLLYFLDRYEKEPLRLLLGAFSWGAVIASGAAFVINSITSLGIYLLTQSELATQLTLTTLVAPVVEETLKGAAVLFIFLAFQKDFDSPLDGIVYAGITALGFAATENTWYIFRFGFLPGGYQGLLDLTLVRTILVGWQHPFYTAFIGLGFSLSRNTHKPVLQWSIPIIGWFLAIFFHLSHNLIATLFLSDGSVTFAVIWDWSGYLGLLALILILIKREQKWMKEFLAPELEQQLINLPQYKTACSAWRQSLAFLKAALSGNYKKTRRFYQACGDLMHIKRQSSRVEDQPGSSIEIQPLRSEISELSKLLEAIA